MKNVKRKKLENNPLKYGLLLSRRSNISLKADFTIDK